MGALAYDATRDKVHAGSARSTFPLLACAALASGFWLYWILFPQQTAGGIGNDALFLLDGARRIAAGQVPHQDFSLPTGVLPYLTYLFAERLFPQFPAYIGAHLLGFVLLSPPIDYTLLIAVFLKIVVAGVVLASLTVLALLDGRWRFSAVIGVSLAGLEFAGVLGLFVARGLAETPPQGPRFALSVAAVSLIAGPLVIGAFENGTSLLLNRQGEPVSVNWVSRYLPHTSVPEPVLRRAAATASLWDRESAASGSIEDSGAEAIDRSSLDLYLAQWLAVDHALRRLDDAQRGRLGAVTTLGNVDFFGLALGATPVLGIELVHDVGRTILPLTPQQARDYVADADTLFVPSCVMNEAPGFERMWFWFAEVLDAEFSPEALTPCWTVHRRNSQSG